MSFIIISAYFRSLFHFYQRVVSSAELAVVQCLSVSVRYKSNAWTDRASFWFPSTCSALFHEETRVSPK